MACGGGGDERERDGLLYLFERRRVKDPEKTKCIVDPADKIQIRDRLTPSTPDNNP